MKILVTGINGRIGKILQTDLQKRHEVFGIDVETDVSDIIALGSIFESLNKIDCIIHLAADSSPEASWGSVLKNNIIGTKNIYDCAAEFSIPKVIFASTSVRCAGVWRKESIFPSLGEASCPSIGSKTDPLTD